MHKINKKNSEQETIKLLDKIYAPVNRKNMSIKTKINKIVKPAVEELARKLGLEIEIITVRWRTGYSQTKLKHIYAQPEAIKNYFELDDKENHIIGIPSFKRSKKIYWKNNEKPFYINVYDLSNLLPIKDDPKPIKSKNIDYAEFSWRINFFLNSLKKQNTRRIDVDNLEKRGACIVLGTHIKDDDNNNNDSIDQLIAIYTKSLPKEKVLNNNIEKMRLYITHMFNGIERAYAINREEFEKEALRKVTEFIPIFSNPEISPADTIQRLIESIDGIFKDHPTTGFVNIDPKDTVSKKQWIKYLTIQFSNDEHNCQKPTFNIFPKKSADENPIGAYIVSRDETRSISKYLLYRTLLTNKAFKIPRKFKRMFDSVAVKSGAIYKASKDSEDIFGIVLTQRDKGWDKLAVEASAVKDGTKTTAAFLMHTEDENNCLRPFGILAFESVYPDAFTKYDIDLLGRIVKAVNLLLVNMKMGDITVDYSKLLKDAMGSLNTKDADGILHGHIMYELLRLDKDAALEIINNSDQIVEKYGYRNILPSKDASNKIRMILDENMIAGSGILSVAGILPGMNPKDKGKRRQWLYNYLDDVIKKVWGKDHLAEIHEFLKAVPSNEVWYCYLSALPRALRERKFNKDNVPTLSVYGAVGFSAFAMFIVDANKEIRQIIKLAENRKNKIEKQLYQKYVRYLIPLAARIPSTGYAIESLGDGDTAKYETESGYGVLVSDLIVEGQRRPSALIRISIESLLKKDKQKLDDIIYGIEHHFKENVKPWTLHPLTDESAYKKELSKYIPGANNYPDQLIKYVTKNIQVNKNNQPSITKDKLYNIVKKIKQNENILNYLKCLIEYYNNQIDKEEQKKDFTDINSCNNLEQLIDVLCDRIEIGGDEYSAGLPDMRNIPARKSIIHGDMNGHNLTWSEDYKRFFIIDFEHVKIGFCGADQLKLIASLICESPREALEGDGDNRLIPAGESSLWQKWYTSLIQSVELIHLFRKSIQDFNSFEEIAKNLKNNNYKTGKITPLTTIIISILKTIDDKDYAMTDGPSNKQFWRYMLRCIFIKQLQYSLNDLDAKADINISEILLRKDDDKAVQLQEGDTPGAIALMFSFLSLLASLGDPKKKK